MQYLYAAFGIVWIVLIAYILNLIKSRKQIKNELRFLENIEQV